MKTVKLTINGKEIEAREGVTVLTAARENGIYIPSLCYHEAVSPAGLCRMCIVEAGGSVRSSIRVSCVQEVQEGLVINTDSEKLRQHRRLTLELLLARAPGCPELLEMARQLGLSTARFHTGEYDTCIRCGLCVRVCAENIGAYALCFSERGHERKVTTPFGRLSETCIGCGACAQVCPTGAIKMEDRGDERKIYTWGQVLARFKLETCDVCGKFIGPKPYLDYIRERTSDPMGAKDVTNMCPNCARACGATPQGAY